MTFNWEKTTITQAISADLSAAGSDIPEPEDFKEVDPKKTGFNQDIDRVVQAVLEEKPDLLQSDHSIPYDEKCPAAALVYKACLIRHGVPEAKISIHNGEPVRPRKILIHLHNFDTSGANNAPLTTALFLREKGYEVEFVSKTDTGAFKSRIEAHGFRVLPAITDPKEFDFGPYKQVFANGIMSSGLGSAAIDFFTKAWHENKDGEKAEPLESFIARKVSLTIHEDYAPQLIDVIRFKQLVEQLSVLIASTPEVIESGSSISFNVLQCLFSETYSSAMLATEEAEVLKSEILTVYKEITGFGIPNLAKFCNTDTSGFWEDFTKVLAQARVIHVCEYSRKLYLDLLHAIQESDVRLKTEDGAGAGTRTTTPPAEETTNHEVIYNIVHAEEWQHKMAALQARVATGYNPRADIPVVESIEMIDASEKLGKRKMGRHTLGPDDHVTLCPGLVGSERKRQNLAIDAFISRMKWLNEEINTIKSTLEAPGAKLEDEEHTKLTAYFEDLKFKRDHEKLLIVGSRGQPLRTFEGDSLAGTEPEDMALPGEYEITGVRAKELADTADMLAKIRNAGLETSCFIVPVTKDMPRYYSLANEVWQVSRSEQLSVSLAEYILAVYDQYKALGKTGLVVANDVAGTAEFICERFDVLLESDDFTGQKRNKRTPNHLVIDLVAKIHDLREVKSADDLNGIMDSLYQQAIHLFCPDNHMAALMHTTTANLAKVASPPRVDITRSPHARNAGATPSPAALAASAALEAALDAETNSDDDDDDHDHDEVTTTPAAPRHPIFSVLQQPHTPMPTSTFSAPASPPTFSASASAPTFFSSGTDKKPAIAVTSEHAELYGDTELSSSSTAATELGELGELSDLEAILSLPPTSTLPVCPTRSRPGSRNGTV